jgi:hypothetical protein
MDDQPTPGPLEVAAVVLGGVVALLGLASVLSFADHLLYLADRDRLSEVASSSVAYVGGEGLLVVAEAAAVVLFTALSTAVLVLRRHPAVVALAVGAAVAKVIWLLASVAANWKPGWYFILDPNGAHQVALYLFAGSIGQAAVMLAAAVAIARRRLTSR